MSNRNLAKHIESLNLEHDVHLIERLDHWADYNVYTPEEMDRYLLEEEYITLFKEVNGVKPRTDMDLLSNETLKKELDQLVGVIETNISNMIDELVEDHTLEDYKNNNNDELETSLHRAFALVE